VALEDLLLYWHHLEDRLAPVTLEALPLLVCLSLLGVLVALLLLLALAVL
tara:strand:+ start:888 stop:1037 length:150 start_codon:yes stop_codon:yes gene_type:complete